MSNLENIKYIYYPDQQVYKIYINNILYTVGTASCFDTSASLQTALCFCFAKVTKTIQVANSIKSAHQNVYVCDHYS